MSGEINVASRTQIIVVEPTSRSVSIIYAGPQGPAGPQGSSFRYLQFGCSDPNGDDVVEQEGLVYFRVNEDFDGGTLESVFASLTHGSTSGKVSVQVRNATQNAYMLSTQLTIDTNETDSSTASVPAVIDAAHKTVNTGDQVFIDILSGAVGAKGLNVELVFRPA